MRNLEKGLPKKVIKLGMGKARKIAPHAGVVKSVLRLFDELAKCDTEGILKEVRDAAEGK
jgi:hypothetical protein